MEISEIQSIQQAVSSYHGSFLLKNIPELVEKDLLAVLGSSYRQLTVTQTREKLSDLMSAESVNLQFAAFQKAGNDKTIDTGAHRLDENKRKELYKDYKLYELLQIAFSPAAHYFQINSPKKTPYTREMYLNAIDVMIIDPAMVPQSSLDALGIKQLDPDCQNLKEIFKKMVSLSYTAGDKKKYTPTINTYGGKFITFSSQSVIYPATQPATQGEKRKHDISTQMAVYPDLFSMIRREGHILDAIEEKKVDYQNIKTDLIGMLKQIQWNDKSYGASIPGQVNNIIEEIQGTTSAKIVALKLYHLYTITGRNKGHDAQRIQAAITKFTQRIGQLIGIGGHVQLHALELEDQLTDQQSDLEMFHAQVKSTVSHTDKITPAVYKKFIFAFENYYTHHAKHLKEPFHTFDAQLKKCFGNIDDLKKQDADTITLKAEIIISLQRKYLETYIWEHAYKNGDMSVDELQKNLLDISNDESIRCHSPSLYDAIFAEINQKRADFSSEFTQLQLNRFFDELNDLHSLQKMIDDILLMLG